MTLDQKLRTMARPEAENFVYGLYSGMAGRVTSNSTYDARETVHLTRGLLWIWPSKRFQEQAQSETEAAVSLLKQLEAGWHGENVQKVTEYLSSEIASAVKFYPGDKKRLEALQQHLEGGLESAVALIEGHKNGFSEDYIRSNKRLLGYCTLGALAGYVVKRALWDGFIGDLTPPGINQDFFTTLVGFGLEHLPVIGGFVAGSIIAMLRSEDYEEKANMRFGEQLKAIEHDALQAFSTPQ